MYKSIAQQSNYLGKDINKRTPSVISEIAYADEDQEHLVSFRKLLMQTTLKKKEGSEFIITTNKLECNDVTSSHKSTY
jgi:hypothetical protein